MSDVALELLVIVVLVLVQAIFTAAEIALVTPRAAEQAMTTHAVAWPPQASAARPPLNAIAASCEPRISLRRSNRSAHDPAQGASSRTGANWQKASTPSRNAE